MFLLIGSETSLARYILCTSLTSETDWLVPHTDIFNHTALFPLMTEKFKQRRHLLWFVSMFFASSHVTVTGSL